MTIDWGSSSLNKVQVPRQVLLHLPIPTPSILTLEIVRSFLGPLGALDAKIVEHLLISLVGGCAHECNMGVGVSWQ
ncbi:hypothetical protein V6N12_046444 [Hibiscus sabdariffa]|uniref:Uncharacterized protein n=1 Tax=Hibiscus sabdariffa TaxID=183260 RepID=A0ABR2DIN9_9ROSI